MPVVSPHSVLNPRSNMMFGAKCLTWLSFIWQLSAGEPQSQPTYKSDVATSPPSPAASRSSQQTCPPPDLTWNHAMEMLRLSTEEAERRGVPVCICIRDRHNNLVASIRMKGAPIGSTDLACQKARSSALFPFPSALLKMVPGVELSNGIISNLQGGLPLITSSGESAGSIGVSGDMRPEGDSEIAQVAVDKIDFILENYW